MKLIIYYLLICWKNIKSAGCSCLQQNPLNKNFYICSLQLFNLFYLPISCVNIHMNRLITINLLSSLLAYLNIAHNHTPTRTHTHTITHTQSHTITHTHTYLYAPHMLPGDLIPLMWCGHQHA